jgi:threonine/homoserine/homoserine lactone efflux protein
MRYLLPVLAIVLLLMMTAGLMGLAAKIRKDVYLFNVLRAVGNFAVSSA